MTYMPESLPSLDKDKVRFFAQREEGVTVEFIVNRLKKSEAAAKALISDNAKDGKKLVMRRVDGVATYFTK